MPMLHEMLILRRKVDFSSCRSTAKSIILPVNELILYSKIKFIFICYMLGNVPPSFFELWQTEIEISFECLGMQTIYVYHRTVINNIKELERN
jgi:hypothetical protein